MPDITVQFKQRRIIVILSAFSAGIVLRPLATSNSITGSEKPLSALYRTVHTLPQELLRMILEIAWPSPFFSPAVVLHECRHLKSLKIDFTSSISLHSSTPVFLRYITYGAVEYIANVSNRRQSTSDEEIHRAGDTYELKLKMDSTGIRSVYFLGRDEEYKASWPNVNDYLTYMSLQSPDTGPIKCIAVVKDVRLGILLSCISCTQLKIVSVSSTHYNE